jgi:hypothetical protein
MISRDEIRHLCLEHDRFMAEARESLRRSPVSESDRDGLIYKDYDNNALLAVPAAEGEPPFAEGEPFNDDQTETLAMLVAGERDLARDERAAEIAALNVKIAELRGKLDAVLTMLGKSDTVSNLKSGDVLDVPNWRRRDVA